MGKDALHPLVQLRLADGFLAVSRLYLGLA